LSHRKRNCVYSLSQHKLSTNIPQQSSLIADMYGVQYPPFKFKHRHESVDWRRISAIDVDRVGSELDFVTLQENIMNITFCNMDSEKCPYCQNPLDPVLLKMFRLAQLTIEYLLHSQEYLTSNLQIYEEKLQAADSEKEQIKKEFCKLSEEIKSQKEECKRRKQIISSQQMMIQAGANNYHKCQYCDKSFMSHFFKQNHVQRRHQEQIDVGEYFTSELENRAMKEEEIKRFEKWKEEEKKKLNDEMEKIKQMFIVEFKEMSAKNSALESVSNLVPLFQQFCLLFIQLDVKFSLL
uniref:C2H2-type domain-containing protein n=1 Tax=Callorhinchus milii TaxID=7868 RepID=A0A4W3I425_CALMI